MLRFRPNFALAATSFPWSRLPSLA
uniref:Uncharacterized protein n=1 Tax=Arundo donax TaxID=35708 RepID=A0A0A9F893_ARUDO